MEFFINEIPKREVTICLNMIVKNESKIIERCFDFQCEYCWCLQYIKILERYLPHWSLCTQYGINTLLSIIHLKTLVFRIHIDKPTIFNDLQYLALEINVDWQVFGFSRLFSSSNLKKFRLLRQQFPLIFYIYKIKTTFSNRIWLFFKTKLFASELATLFISLLISKNLILHNRPQSLHLAVRSHQNTTTLIGRLY